MLITVRARILQMGALMAVISLLGLDADAWEFREHWYLGETSYTRACDMMEAASAKLSPDAQYRLHEIACLKMNGAYYYAEKYGQYCAVAGDHLSHPDDFKSKLSGRTVEDFGSYGLLAAQNSDHFHPHVVTYWLDNHNKAMAKIIEAANKNNLETQVIFDDAFNWQAFGDHYLQDSFVSGHMGFNRAASSAAASMVFHDYWNAKGRLISDSTGSVRMIYGDGSISKCLSGSLQDGACTPELREQKDKLVEITTQSVYQFIHSFVTGKRDLRQEVNTYLELPHKIQAPADKRIFTLEKFLKPAWRFGKKNDDHELQNLSLINEPARVSFTMDTWYFQYLPAAIHKQDTHGMVVGFSLMYVDWKIPIRIYAGYGKSEYNGLDKSDTWDAGYIFPLFNSNDGLISHELSAGTTQSNQYSASNISYRLNFEFGKVFIRSQVGLANGGRKEYSKNGETFRSSEYQYYFNIGVGYALYANGGGAKH